MSAVFIGGATAVAGLGLKAYEGLHQDHEANQIQKNLKDPTYNIPAEFLQNKNIAAQMAQIGMPQQQYNNATNQIQANQAAAIAAASNSNNPSGAIAKIQGQTNAATGNLNAEDAAARQNNQRYSLQQNAAYGDQELAKQQNDVFDKYTRNFNLMQAYRGAGTQNLMGAASDATSLAGTAISAYAGQGQTPTFGQAYGLPNLQASAPQFTPPASNPPQGTIPYYQIAQ